MNAVRNNGKGVARWPLHIYAAIALCITLSAPPPAVRAICTQAPKRVAEGATHDQRRLPAGPKLASAG